MSARKAVWECAAVERRARKGVRLRSGYVSDQISDLEVEAKCFQRRARKRVKLRNCVVRDQISVLEIEARCFVSGEGGRGLVT